MQRWSIHSWVGLLPCQIQHLRSKMSNVQRLTSFAHCTLSDQLCIPGALARADVLARVPMRYQRELTYTWTELTSTARTRNVRL